MGIPSIRLATPDDLASLRTLMDASIGALQRGFLSDSEIQASRMLMGLDTQLIEDGTYFVAELEHAIAGCGGWSRRATLYGGSHSPGRNPALLNPARDAARVRAMYTHPSFARRGVGSRILDACEAAARAEGFTRVELAATLSGVPLYERHGYEAIESFTDDRGGVPVPLVRMGKGLFAPH
jgi:GNAT superfamily N-acetyltransferase